MRIIHVVLLCAFSVSLGGCGAVGLAVFGAGAGAGMGAGVDYTMNGIAYKTYAAPIKNVRVATLKTFDDMGMPVVSDQRTPNGWQLTATAADRTINVELETLTPKTTRMRIVADEGQFFFKDKATESEIIAQTAQVLDSRSRLAHTKTRPRLATTASP
jgi:Protein of unknown function (DUF3568)